MGASITAVSCLGAQDSKSHRDATLSNLGLIIFQNEEATSEKCNCVHLNSHALCKYT